MANVNPCTASAVLKCVLFKISRCGDDVFFFLLIVQQCKLLFIYLLRFFYYLQVTFFGNLT